jgi:hypothetical protein
MRVIVSFLVLCLLAFTACRKNDDITTSSDVELSFSSDTVLFDTVFTAVGSINKRIKVYNNDSKAINITNIRLGEGLSSFFSLIINGVVTNEKSNVQVGGKDSISIYVKATINSNTQNKPFIVEDSIVFNINGNHQAIKLIAYGQNARFINGGTISSNTIWDARLPYIINRSVTVAAGVSLDIYAGTKVYFHGSSVMNIRGTLNVNGAINSAVLFSSDRLENFYENEAGQWLGIRLFASSVNNKVNYAIIKNAVVGITADSVGQDGNAKLLLANSMIKNMTIAGFVGYSSSLTGFNNLFYNSGQYLVYGVGGGIYNLKQNTFAAFNTEFPRRTSALYFSDLSNTSYSDLSLDLINNIIWGSLPEELLIEEKTTASITSNIKYNVIKTSLQTYDKSNLLGLDPKFVDATTGNFRIQPGSPVLKKGIDLSSDIFYSPYLKKDIDFMQRTFPSTIGCYER